MPTHTELETPHVFAGNPLNRGEVLRRNEDWLASAPSSTDARFLPLHQLKVALVEDPANGADRHATSRDLHWFSRHELDAHFGSIAIGAMPLLGVDDQSRPHFAVDITAAPETSTGYKFVDARHAAATLDTASAGIVAHARAQLHWHTKNGFCAACGGLTQAGRGGQIRKCPACDTHIFPRTDPVVIMLVCDDTHCLLGQGKMRMPRMKIYSALAGFVDQAESIEEAVRREVMEEAGIKAGAVRYHSSQPWPFPSSLMIGAHAEPLTHDINFDTEEMADVGWFTREEVRAAFAGEGAFGLPGEIAIAHHLIKHWLDQE